jgi:hypothetical protein
MTQVCYNQYHKQKRHLKLSHLIMEIQENKGTEENWFIQSTYQNNLRNMNATYSESMTISPNGKFEYTRLGEICSDSLYG